ncbi:MAG: hypothetical protein LKH74_08580 [Levilactobacillus sp.]|uniref:hypothetical protein n=1 Tax=Levilactobacillus sp. TaxID=2767919 RepID=UPI00258297FA|nr:hypothetical protein [Levilactobacillus sp.]MCH4123869.1 hypothetical protein [Levilactobacillus sp.]MCI1553967.1 hypothetical protein [Levilactobacillus sp.]MCI1599158.1 hypothetical protein [Levilactobacillus sp.]MCI1605451.1 hypothetical protein [Levilactobacillus sp.]
MKKRIVGLLVLGGLMSGGLMTQPAQAAKSYRLNWMHARARSTFKFRKSGYKHYAYTLHKVKHNRYRLKRAYRLGTMKNKQVHQVKAMSLSHYKYEFVYVTYKGKGAWVNEKYVVFSRSKKVKKRSASTAKQRQVTQKSTATGTKTTGTKTTSTKTTSPATTGKKNQSNQSNTASSTTSTSTKFYIKTNKHISWQEWLSLPDLKGEVQGLTFYHVDNVPYDEDGFPYVTQNMFAAPLQVRMMKDEFTSATYQAIADKWDTYYVSDKHALFCPTNTEDGQAIRDQMPD